MPIAREGWPYLGVGLAIAALLALRFPAAGAVVALLSLALGAFFRDPERTLPSDPRLVVSPADGKVVRIAAAPPDNPAGPGAQQVSIFLSVFDVHINRSPVAGRITAVDYHPGAFLPAFNHDASDRNERNRVTIVEDRTGLPLAFTQIAGLIARRIVFRKRVGDRVERGERVGLIQFGSRVDVFLPPRVKLRLAVGDRVQGGASVIGEWP